MAQPSSVVIAEPSEFADEYYRPPIVAQRAISIGLNSHVLLQPSSHQVTQADRLIALKRAKQAAYRSLLDADRVATIPEDRKPLQLPSPQKEATGFMVGRQRLDEEITPKAEQQARWKSDLAEAAALPAIVHDRRPFPHRAYTPCAQPAAAAPSSSAPSISRYLSSLSASSASAHEPNHAPTMPFPMEDDEATKAAKRRAQAKKNLLIHREDVIAKINNSPLSPAERAQIRAPAPVGGKAAATDGRVYVLGAGPQSNSGLAIGPDLEAEKTKKIKDLAAFQATVKVDLDDKLRKKQQAEAANLAILQAKIALGTSQSCPTLTLPTHSFPTMASLPAQPSPNSKLKDAYIDHDGFTTVQIGGDTSDMRRGKTALLNKRAAQKRYSEMLQQQLHVKAQYEASMQKSNLLHSLDKEENVVAGSASLAIADRGGRVIGAGGGAGAVSGGAARLISTPGNPGNTPGARAQAGIRGTVNGYNAAEPEGLYSGADTDGFLDWDSAEMKEMARTEGWELD